MPLAYTRKKRTIVIEVDCHRRKGQHPHAERQGQKNRERSLGELVFVLFHYNFLSLLVLSDAKAPAAGLP